MSQSLKISISKFALHQSSPTNSSASSVFKRLFSSNFSSGAESGRYREGGARSFEADYTNPPEPIPDRPLRDAKPLKKPENFARKEPSRAGGGRGRERDRMTGGGRPLRTSSNLNLFNERDVNEEKGHSGYSKERPNPLNSEKKGQEFIGKKSNSHSPIDEKKGHDFLEKFRLGLDQKNKENDNRLPGKQQPEEATSEPEMEGPPEDADKIFNKMKETGLIPNAVAMLDGLCKDGLVQEAMKVFGLMREKGTFPEVVIYTAVVDGFIKAQKLNDAQRIFKKMQKNGIVPNAFSYSVLIQGLSRGKRLEDAVNFCLEMLEAGHSPNVATFVGLVDLICEEIGLEECQRTILALRQKGFAFDEKAVREYLETKGRVSPVVWEAIFGTKSNFQRSS